MNGKSNGCMQVLAHDPGVAELNMSITTGPIPAGVPLASAEEVIYHSKIESYAGYAIC